MRISRFYYPDLSASMTTLVLPENVHRHAIQVLRLKNDDKIRLFNGNGLEVEAILTRVEKRHAEAHVTKTLSTVAESPLVITLLQGISRGERMDYAIQKAVELGVTTIVPVITERCNVQLKGERADKRYQHWLGVMISACEQSGRAILPTLAPVSDLTEAVSRETEDLKIVLDPEAQQRFTQLTSPKGLTLLIGPEGGLSEQEIRQVQQHDFTPVQFGPRILRTETATVAALAVVQTLWGDLG